MIIYQKEKNMQQHIIKINDLLHFQQQDLENVKIRFNQWNGSQNPMEDYKRNPDLVNNDWLFWRTKTRFFYVGQIVICLLKLSEDNWLLTTIKKVTKELGKYNGVNYEGEELEEYKQYFGRVIIKYHKTQQAMGIYYKKIYNNMEVQQILPTIYDGQDFEGYDKVKLSYQQLENILSKGKRDWIAALENQKAVYLITDKQNGKLYVGSATSDNGMLLQRWKNYISNGHGANKELIKLVNEKGIQYVKNNFQYSILENYNAKIDDKIILKRESWWKEILQTRKFGYNKN